ncbi:hypothetical protein [Nannocystis sp. SCPEA4]|uniref:hypothetical protein n=1 Tax=Nannocystis sp. SCPEA4 TaxID=2996787 RepID=UPI00226FA10D|nr:hypothetical protein [Nannocystis sp. SCPEA4]MCY1056175.1 hypothetical protein [Nannocystis sp. SCPEA4]
MAKKLALAALLLSIAALFLPLRSLFGITEGAFAGIVPNMALGLMMTVPSILPSFFGVLVGRKGFARGLGVLHLIFGLIGVGLCGLAATKPEGIELTVGGYMAFAAAALVLVAGFIGLAKPERR